METATRQAQKVPENKLEAGREVEKHVVLNQTRNDFSSGCSASVEENCGEGVVVVAGVPGFIGGIFDVARGSAVARTEVNQDK